jgi:hypothetical protein
MQESVDFSRRQFRRQQNPDRQALLERGDSSPLWLFSSFSLGWLLAAGETKSGSPPKMILLANGSSSKERGHELGEG